MNKLQELEAKYKELGEEINKLKQGEIGRYKPDNNQEYWCIDQDGDISINIWRDSYYDNQRYLFGNVFRTEEEVEFELERLKVIAELSEYASEFVLDGANWGFYWDYDSEEMEYTWNITSKRAMLYFSSEKIARQAVEAVGENRVKKYYLRVR